jgi:hypothetical protein
LEAWKELQEIVVNTTPEMAAEGFHRAKNEIETLQLSSSSLPPESSQNNKNTIESQLRKELEAISCTDSEKGKDSLKCDGLVSDMSGKEIFEPELTRSNNNSNSNNNIAKQVIDTTVAGASKDNKGVKSASRIPIPEDSGVTDSLEEYDEDEQTEVVHPYFDFYIEHLAHLSSYQIDVRLKRSISNSDTNNVENWSIKLTRDENDGISMVHLYNNQVEQTLVLRLEGLVQRRVDSISEQRGTLSIRLSFEGDCEPVLSTRVSSKTIVNNLACSGCGTRLIADTENNNNNDTPRIKRVLTLPSGIWDEMTDYLICFEGQPSIDFTYSTTEAQRGVVLEDDSVLVYHLPDVVPHVQVLAIPGYGEDKGEVLSSTGDTIPAQQVPRAAPLTRGTHMWSDAVGGATVTCSYCCWVLGVAPVELPDTVRFFKHRVTATNGEQDSRRTVTSTLKFCIQSMVRYAESKAIFSFVVRPESKSQRGIILQLMGWDRKSARAYKKEKDDDLSLHKLAWSRLAKVLFEERTDLPVYNFSSTSSSPLNISWANGVDWCCPPGNNFAVHEIKDEKKTDHVSELPSSYVSFWIDDEEWASFCTDLDAAQETCTREVFTATFLAKNGRLPPGDSFSGLAAIFLD